MTEPQSWFARSARDPGAEGLPRALKLDACVDSFLLLAFLANQSFLTGMVLHEWVGASLAIALVAHITLHWDWVARTTAGARW